VDSIVITTFDAAATAAGVSAATAPAATSPLARPAVRFHTVTWWPAATSRAAIGPPI
jgi:hypothetical protein